MKRCVWTFGMISGFAIDGLDQDRFGSLNGYIQHLQQPGVWHQTPIGAWVALLALGMVIGVIGAIEADK